METKRAIFLEHPISGVLLLVMISVPLMAHHGTGGTYEMEKPITLKGALTEFKFVNPHVLIFFNVPNKDGKKGGVVNWVAAGPSVINWKVSSDKNGEGSQASWAAHRFLVFAKRGGCRALGARCDQSPSRHV